MVRCGNEIAEFIDVSGDTVTLETIETSENEGGERFMVSMQSFLNDWEEC